VTIVNILGTYTNGYPIYCIFLIFVKRHIDMVDIRFLCPECGEKLSIDMCAAACLVDCPHCRTRIRPWNTELVDHAFPCPGCAVVLLVDTSLAGEVIACSECLSEVRVPKDSKSDPTLLSKGKGENKAMAKLDSVRTVRLSSEEIEFLMTASGADASETLAAKVKPALK